MAAVRHALVTGGGRGIGRAIAAALTAAGHRVTVLGRDAARLGAVVAAGEAAAFATADVTDGKALADALAALPPVDILVANAGTIETASFLKATPDQFRRMIDVHLMGLVHPAQAVLPGMIERRFGRVVAIASTASLKGYPYVSAYGAAKHAMLGLVRSLALETARTGVTVNAVCPGYTDTDLVRESLERTAVKSGRSLETLYGDILADKPLGRLVLPHEVAASVVWLAGEHAGAVTGQAIVVDGGETVA